MPIRRSPNGARHVRPQPGRNRPEWVVAINWNAWSQSIGTGGRNHPVRAYVNEDGSIPVDSVMEMQDYWADSPYSTRYRKAKARKGLTGSFGDRIWLRKAII